MIANTFSGKLSSKQLPSRVFIYSSNVFVLILLPACSHIHSSQAQPRGVRQRERLLRPDVRRRRGGRRGGDAGPAVPGPVPRPGRGRGAAGEHGDAEVRAPAIRALLGGRDRTGRPRDGIGGRGEPSGRVHLPRVPGGGGDYPRQPTAVCRLREARERRRDGVQGEQHVVRDTEVGSLP